MQVDALQVSCLFVGVQTSESEKATPNLPQGLLWSVLSWPKKFAFQVRSFTSPNTGQDAVAGWIADFGETLDLKKEQATQINFFHGTVLEVIGQQVIHQDAVIFAQELGQDGCREVDAGIDAAEELSDGRKPVRLKMGQGDTRARKD